MAKKALGQSYWPLLAVLLLAGCAMGKDVGMVPELSPVHTELAAGRLSADSRSGKGDYSLYRTSANSFFKDPRAMRRGDILTVLISINDRANLNNRSDMKKDSDSKYDIGAGYSLFQKLGANISASAGSGAHSKGDGKIQRNEDIKLSIAAVVTDILPNGNLIIQGSQEVRVNYELRVLKVAGIVRPRDISGNNTIAYDKIAEARVSYGGRGRISELQQPPYGQQYLNRTMPF